LAAGDRRFRGALGEISARRWGSSGTVSRRRYRPVVNRLEVAPASPAHRDRVVDTVVSAFESDPAFRYFFPDDADYRRHAGKFVGYLFAKRVSRQTVWVIDGGAAVAMWDPPAAATVDHGALRQRQAGQSLVAAPAQPTLDLPAATIARITAYDSDIHAALPSGPHWYLGLLATHPDFAGRRWGRTVMNPGLERAAADRLPAYLETSNPYNVGLYRRAGWEVAGSRTAQGVKIWIMTYPVG
jgi:ribosomal protein S18 acetylase RimI-like enzyme